MACRQALGWSEGEVMRPESKPCSRLMRHTAGIFSVGGALAFWVLCRLHYGPRITVPRSLRWASCGAISTSSTSALLVRLFSPECEPQNIAAYDRPEYKPAQYHENSGSMSTGSMLVCSFSPGDAFSALPMIPTLCIIQPALNLQISVFRYTLGSRHCISETTSYACFRIT